MTAGRKIRKLVPTPNSDWHKMKPPLCSTMPRTVARPSPVPLPGSLVVKERLEDVLLHFASMPMPVSDMASVT